MTTNSEEPKCVHDWHVKAKTRTEGNPMWRGGTGPAETIRAIMQGTTSFLLTCSKCGAIETRELYGKVST